MNKLDTALRRGVITIAIVAGLVAALILVTGLALAKVRINDPLAPEGIPQWDPPSGSTQTLFIQNGNTQPIKAVVISGSPLKTFTTVNSWYRIYNPSLPGVEITGSLSNPANMNVVNNGAFLSVNTSLLYGNGHHVQFYAYYSDGSGYEVGDYPVAITSATNWTYLPLVNPPSTSSGGNSNPCAAVNATAGTVYGGGVPTSPYDFFRLNMPVTGTIFMTVSNYFGTGQLQLRSDLTDTNCSAVTSTRLIDSDYVAMPPSTNSVAAYNLTPGTYFARISNDTTLTTSYGFAWTYQGVTGVLEPNNNSCQAWPISLGTTYQKYPQDQEDWFGFDVSTASVLQITVTNYTGTGAQVQLYQQGSDCSQIGSPVVYAPINGNPGALTLTTPNQVAAGHYFVRVYSGGGYNTSTLYSLKVNTAQAVWNPIFNAGNGGRARNDGYGNFYVDYTWTGLPGATEIRFTWTGNGSVFTDCPAGWSYNSIDITDQPTILSGHYDTRNKIGSLPTGYSIVDIYAYRSSDGKSYNNQQNIKTNCNPPGLNLSPQWPEKVTATPAGPAVPATPTPVPPPVLAPEVRPTPEP